MSDSTVQRRLLLVEDEPINQTLGVVRLRKIGWIADIAANGYEALDKLQQKSYELVLMDCQMPEMDGFTATTAIRSSEPQTLNPDIPIIAMTAGFAKDHQFYLAAGMDDFISKLATTKELAAKLEYWSKESNHQKHTSTESTAPTAQLIPSLQDNEFTPPAISFEKDQSAEIDHTQIFNEDEFLKRLMDDHALAKLIVNVFLRELPVQIVELKQYICDGDQENTRRLAHGIRGASSNLAACSLTNTIRMTEEFARQDNYEKMLLSISEIEVEFEKFAQTVQQLDWMEIMLGSSANHR